MGDEALRYAVLLSRPEQLDFHALAEALARLRSVPVLDAVHEARSCWGILGGHQEEAAARQEAAALAAAGFSTLALPENLVEDLPDAVMAARAELKPEASDFYGAEAAPLRVTAQDVVLLCAVVLKREATQTITTQKDISLGQKALQVGLLMATGLPIGTARMRKEEKKTVPSPELWGVLDIVLKDPARRLRLFSESFDYSCLGADKVYDTLGNLRVLARRLAALWPEAGRNRGLGFILEGKPQREMGYETLDDLEREARWLLTLRTLRA
ncbi:MAG: hypothetical protein HY926_08770 [Elusimicrobia bacterium]|nr:hypothetical protein [Elusimicrobiota bacterium]